MQAGKRIGPIKKYTISLPFSLPPSSNLINRWGGSTSGRQSEWEFVENWCRWCNERIYTANTSTTIAPLLRFYFDCASVGGVQCGYRIHVRPPEKEKSEQQLLLFIQPLNVQYIYLSWQTHTKGIRRIKVYSRRRLYLDKSKRKAAAVIDRRVCGVLSINSDLFHTPKGPETVCVLPLVQQLLDTVGEHTERETRLSKVHWGKAIRRAPPRHFASLLSSIQQPAVLLVPSANIDRCGGRPSIAALTSFAGV